MVQSITIQIATKLSEAFSAIDSELFCEKLPPIILMVDPFLRSEATFAPDKIYDDFSGSMRSIITLGRCLYRMTGETTESISMRILASTCHECAHAYCWEMFKKNDHGFEWCTLMREFLNLDPFISGQAQHAQSEERTSFSDEMKIDHKIIPGGRFHSMAMALILDGWQLGISLLVDPKRQ